MGAFLLGCIHLIDAPYIEIIASEIAAVSTCMCVWLLLFAPSLCLCPPTWSLFLFFSFCLLSLLCHSALLSSVLTLSLSSFLSHSLTPTRSHSQLCCCIASSSHSLAPIDHSCRGNTPLHSSHRPPATPANNRKKKHNRTCRDRAAG